MTDSANMAERHAPILAELAALGLSLARAAHEEALAAETPAAKAEMTLAFHRISRSVRQTLALEAKLARDRQQQQREVRAETVNQKEKAVYRRRSQVRLAVERLIWTEAEGQEAERLFSDLDDILEEEVLYDSFTVDPVEAHIARICTALGLTAAAPHDGMLTEFPPDESGRRSSG
jgi:hypothetical protein